MLHLWAGNCDVAPTLGVVKNEPHRQLSIWTARGRTDNLRRKIRNLDTELDAVYKFSIILSRKNSARRIIIEMRCAQYEL